MSKVNLEKDVEEKLKTFQKVFEAVMGEKTTFEAYVNTVLMIGLDEMIRDAIPEGQEFRTIQAAFTKDYKFMCDLLTAVWRVGKDLSDEEKKAIRDRIGQYIT
ncbi:MAG TPA: hypothetical protein VI893_07305 [Thermoplasmata archaeon]|nr:hypothetical protein [Thermoplasmata archaeon]